MAGLEFNTNNIRKVPVHRNPLFYSEESFAYEFETGKNYVEQDMNQTAVLYSVDLSATNVDSLYGETDENSVIFKTPVEFHCVYQIDEPELKSYDSSKNLGTYVKTGKLKLGVYQQTLDELGIDIKKGDYIGILINPSTMIYFTVANEGMNNYDNGKTLFGTVPLYREILCTPVDKSEFKA